METKTEHRKLARAESFSCAELVFWILASTFLMGLIVASVRFQEVHPNKMDTNFIISATSHLFACLIQGILAANLCLGFSSRCPEDLKFWTFCQIGFQVFYSIGAGVQALNSAPGGGHAFFFTVAIAVYRAVAMTIVNGAVQELSEIALPLTTVPDDKYGNQKEYQQIG
jgi:hypothetical protein